MRLQEAWWFPEEDQWRTRVIVCGRGGKDAVLLFRMPDRDRKGGRRSTPVVAEMEAEVRREVGANSEEVN